MAGFPPFMRNPTNQIASQWQHPVESEDVFATRRRVLLVGFRPALALFHLVVAEPYARPKEHEPCTKFGYRLPQEPKDTAVFWMAAKSIHRS